MWSLSNGACTCALTSLPGCNAGAISPSTCLCTSCQNGYKLVNGACVACAPISHCTTYHSADCTCIGCQTGWLAAGYACNCPYIDRCSTYDNSCACSSCASGTLTAGQCVCPVKSHALTYDWSCNALSCDIGY